MTTVTHDSDADTPHGAPSDPGHDGHHPSDGLYWKVGAILGVITALEVSTYFITDDPYSHDLKWLLIGGLLVMMTAKFIAIGAFFMHLKFDNKLFRIVFVGGLVLAVAVYIVVLATMEYWSTDYEDALRLIT